MPRSLVLGNGSVLATFDEHLQMRDCYFPYVGMEDHTAYGDTHRIGCFVEGGGCSWTSDEEWKADIRYRSDTLVGDSELRNDRLGLVIRAIDFVHPVHNILVRHWLIKSTNGTQRKVKFFFHHDLHIYGDKQKDTAFYEPFTNSVIHYRQTRYFLISAVTSNPVESPPQRNLGMYQSILPSKVQIQSGGITEWSIGKADYRGLEGTWRDAEDGHLGRNPIEQGSVDSTVGIACLVDPEREISVTTHLCFGKTLDEVVHVQQIALHEGEERLERHTSNYWRSWVSKVRRDFGSLDPAIGDLYHRSLLLMRIHADNRGGIVAAADADIMAFNRDTYTYVWPRDCACTCMAFDAAGFSEVTRRFFRFCKQLQTPDGYLLQKYNPDGSFGSSWHPWFKNGEAQLPIQEDETALVLVALWKHFTVQQDFEFLQEMYEGFTKKAAEFLCLFREEATGLPLASYDLWEEHRGIFTYTTACVAAGLQAAARICIALGHHAHSERYQTAADEVRQALLFHLYDEGMQRFLKKIQRKEGETVERDATPDMSIAAIWKLGVLPVDDTRVISTMRQLQDLLTVRSAIGGIARYAGDFYHAIGPPCREIPGNPWIITTLWAAQWEIAKAKNSEDLQNARKALEWTLRWSTGGGILPEQVHPHTGAPLSVAPLVWSHATFVETVLLYLEKEKQ